MSNEFLGSVKILRKIPASSGSRCVTTGSLPSNSGMSPKLFKSCALINCSKFFLAFSCSSLLTLNPIALVFGNEHSGVSEEIRAMADGNFVIPQVGIIQSLNISVACAVTLYEAFRQKEIAGHYQGNSQEGAARLQLLKDWELE